MKKIIALFLLSVSIILNGAEPPPNCPNLYIRCVGGRNGIQIGFETIPGLNYSVLTSTNLVHWTTATNFVATGYVHSMFFSSDSAPVEKQQFIRVKYVCPQ